MNGKKVAIVQSNYIPWKGYFDMIAAVDEFILYDDMQYTKRDWRNRNLIKTPQGTQWLTVPVLVKGKFDQRIRDTLISGDSWALDHWKALYQNYRRTPHFDAIATWLEPIYLGPPEASLSVLNRRLIEAICSYLGITTKISNSCDYPMVEGKTERLVGLCRLAGGCTYISGPAARDYLDEQVFRAQGLAVDWFDYSGYPEYPQQWGAFVHGVSILDLLFNLGSDAAMAMRHVRPRQTQN
jgi:hypothetical protein